MIKENPKELTMLNVARQHGIEHIRCPFCARRFEAYRYINDLLGAACEALVSGEFSLRLPFIGLIKQTITPADDLKQRDSYFKPHERDWTTFGLTVPRDTILALSRGHKKQNSKKSEEKTNNQQGNEEE